MSLAIGKRVRVSNPHDHHLFWATGELVEYHANEEAPWSVRLDEAIEVHGKTLTTVRCDADELEVLE